MTGRVHLRATHSGDHEVGARSSVRSVYTSLGQGSEDPAVRRAEAIAVPTNVLNGTARTEWAPHTAGYVE